MTTGTGTTSSCCIAMVEAARCAAELHRWRAGQHHGVHLAEDHHGLGAHARTMMQVVNKGALVGTYTTTSPIRPGTGTGPVDMVRLDRAPRVSPMQRVFGAAMYGLAYAFAPQDATAQGLSMYRCRVEWLRFSSAAIIVFAAGSALSAAPVLTGILLSSFVSAITSAAIAEDALLDCILNHSQLTFNSFSGGGAGVATDKWNCFGGSFSAHCTTAWTV